MINLKGFLTKMSFVLQLYFLKLSKGFCKVDYFMIVGVKLKLKETFASCSTSTGLNYIFIKRKCKSVLLVLLLFKSISLLSL